jgi:DNA-binding PadR family transcriptional regulator
MSLKHTLLGLLILEPQTGYDLYKRVEQLTFLLESATLRRIYPTLKRLAEDDLVEFEVEPQEGKPDRKIYSITDQGQTEFLLWLREPVKEDPSSINPLFAKLFFYGMLDLEIVRERIQDSLAFRRKQRQELLALQVRGPGETYRDIVDPARVGKMWQFMVDYVRLKTDTQIEWLESVLGQLAEDIE